MRNTLKTAGRLFLAGGLVTGPALGALALAQAPQRPPLADGEPAPAATPVQPRGPVGPSVPAAQPSPSTPAPAPQPQPAPGAPSASGQQPAPAEQPSPADQPAPEGAAPVNPAAPQPPLNPGQQALLAQLKLSAETSLAERFCEMAQSRLRAPVVTEAMWKQAGALLDAAHLLDPADPRYVRFQHQVAMKTGDLDKAVKTLSDYRQIAKDDVAAQLQQISLNVSRMQTADAKKAYLAGGANEVGLMHKTQLAPELRSHAAMLAASIIDDTQGRGDALKMLDKAIEIFPLNATALRLKYAMMDAGAPVAERTALLLARLKANPAQPDALTELADRLSELGLSNEAARWYNTARPLFNQSGKAVPAGFAADYATQLFLSGQIDASSALLKAYLTSQPLDSNAWFVRLAVERPRGDRADASVIADARQALDRRWQLLDDQIQGKPAAPADPGQPAPVIIAPDPDASIEILKKPEASQSDKQLFAEVVSDLAWFELYFGNDLDAAERWVKALGAVLPADSTELIKLNGWLQIMRGGLEEPRKTLEPIKAKDPLAAAGLVRLDFAEAAQLQKAANDVALIKPAAEAEAELIVNEAEADKAKTEETVKAAREKADEVRKNADADVARLTKAVEENAPRIKELRDRAETEAQRLLSEHRAGVVAALLWGEFKGRGVKQIPDPIGQAVKDVKGQLAGFPAQLLGILTQPQSFYQVRVEPRGFAFDYRKPIYADVTIQNVSPFELTIGPDGVIRPDLWFDADINIGVNIQRMSGVAFDYMAGPVVLKPGTAVRAQLVRIDQSRLLDTLNANPIAAIQVSGALLINPVGSAKGMWAGPAGQRIPFKVVRTGFNPGNPQAAQQVIQKIQGGLPSQKIASMDLLAACTVGITRIPNPDPKLKDTMVAYLQAIAEARGDQFVAGVANYELAIALPNPLERAQTVNQMASDLDWTTKLLALDAMNSAEMTKEQQLEIAKAIADRNVDGVPNEKGEKLLKEYAQATVQLIMNPPATQPAAPEPEAAPATQPAGPAPAGTVDPSKPAGAVPLQEAPTPDAPPQPPPVQPK